MVSMEEGKIYTGEMKVIESCAIKIVQYLSCPEHGGFCCRSIKINYYVVFLLKVFPMSDLPDYFILERKYAVICQKQQNASYKSFYPTR